GAQAGGAFDLRPQCGGRVAVEDPEFPFVADHEHLGSRGDALGVAEAGVEIDGDAHAAQRPFSLTATGSRGAGISCSAGSRCAAKRRRLDSELANGIVPKRITNTSSVGVTAVMMCSICSRHSSGVPSTW